MIRLVVFLALAVGVAWCATTVPLGKRTLVGHVRAIWATSEVQELKEGVVEKAGPAADRVKRGVEKGLEAATDDTVPDGGLPPDAQKLPPAERPAAERPAGR